MEEARTALATREIQTPSLPSPESSHAGDGEGDLVEGKHAGRSIESKSSGERYEASGSEDCSSGSRTSLEVNSDNFAKGDASGSEEYSFKTAETTSEDTDVEYSSTSDGEENSVTEISSASEETPKVCSNHDVAMHCKL